MGDGHQVLLVEQRQLQRLGGHQGLDLVGAQRAEPIQVSRAQLLGDGGSGEHAAVADQGDPAQPEPGGELADLGGQRLGVGGVAVEHLDGHRYPGGGAQQPVDDLAPAFDPVAGVPDRPQRAGAALKRRRGHVIEHQRPIHQMPGGQGVFDAFLAGQRPVHRRIQVVLITARHAEDLTQRTGGGLGAQPPRGGQLGVWGDHRRDQHGHHQIPPPRRRRVDQLGQPQSLRCGQHGGHMPVRQAAGDLERLGQLQLRRQPFERPRQRIDLVLGPVRQVGQRAVLHLAALAVALPQKDRRR